MSATSRTQAVWKAAEAIAVVALLALNLTRVKPFADSVLYFLFPLGWLSMRLRGVSWKSVGLSVPANWRQALLLGSVGGIGIQALGTLAVDPLLKWSGLPMPKVEGLTNLATSGAVGLAVTMLAVWSIGGYLEELCFRGYLMTRIHEFFGARSGMIAGVLLSTAYFGLCHSYQGASGMIGASVNGLLFGLAYARTRNLLLPMVLHAVVDTAGVALLAAGFTGW